MKASDLRKAQELKERIEHLRLQEEVFEVHQKVRHTVCFGGLTYDNRDIPSEEAWSRMAGIVLDELHRERKIAEKQLRALGVEVEQ